MNTPSKSGDTAAELEPLALSPQLRAAVRARLSPGIPDQARVRNAVWSSVASGELSKRAQRVEILMQARAALGDGRLLSGWSSASKLITAGLLVATAVGVVTLSDLPFTPAPVTPAPVTPAPRAVPQTEETSKAPVVTPVAASSPVALEESTVALAHAQSVFPAHNASTPSAKSAPMLGAGVRRVRPQPPAAMKLVAGIHSAKTDTNPVVDMSAASAQAATLAHAVTPQPQLQLAAELRLVRAASHALDQGDAAAALSQLQKYAARYPSGALRVESAALRAVALCIMQAPDASAARKSFLTAHGNSPLAERVKGACDAPP